MVVAVAGWPSSSVRSGSSASTWWTRWPAAGARRGP
jgi:hypothetical protein